MTSFVALEEGIEVNGTTINSVMDGMGAFHKMGQTILSDAGISDLQNSENSWYSQQNWLNAFKRISEKIGKATLRQIGKKIPENAVFPPQVTDVKSALRAIDIAYHMNHRNTNGEVLFHPERTPPILEGIGHYTVVNDKSTENSDVVMCDNPYPCDFDYGIIISMAKRFDFRAKVEHMEGSCRNDGLNTCSYLITW